MNTIGIDYQHTLTVVCLGEGRGAAARVRNVGDGLRPIIPNAVHGDELWGSRALEAGAGINDVEDGPWLTEPGASVFWLRLYQRLYNFLGRIAPTAQQGYRVIAGLQAADWRTAVDGVERLSAQAGFGAPTCITATDALLARHLAEPGAFRAAGAGDSTVTVVAAGDTATTVSSYRVRRESRAMPRLLARDNTPRHLPFGQAHWAGRLLVHITDLFTEPIRSGYDLAMRDSALEFGSRLRRAPSGRAVTWTGPFRDKLYAPLELTAADCAAWPEAAPFVQRLPNLIRESAASLGGAPRPDLILVGGIGALWPFAASAAATVGPVQQSGSPEEDVARGAAWWPEVEALWADIGSILSGSAFNAPLPDWLSGTSTGIPSDFAVVETEPHSFFQQAEEIPSFFASGTAVSQAPTDLPPFLRDEPVSAASGGSVTSSFPAEPEEPFNPFLPRTEIETTPGLPPSQPGGDTFNPFLPRTETESVGSPTIQQEAPAPAYDLPTRTSSGTSEEEVDLDSLPPWDPRRNEM